MHCRQGQATRRKCFEASKIKLKHRNPYEVHGMLRWEPGIKIRNVKRQSDQPSKRRGSVGGTKESLLTDAQVLAIRMLLNDKISNNTSMRSLNFRLESFAQHTLRVFSNYSHKHFAVAGFYAATYLGHFAVNYFHCGCGVAYWNPGKINERNMYCNIVSELSLCDNNLSVFIVRCMFRQWPDLALRQNAVSLEYNPVAKKSLQRPHKR